MYKNIVFDFGRVIVDFDEMYMTGVFIKDEKEKKLVRDIVFDRLYWDKLDSGDITDDEVKALACERLPEHLREPACRVYDNWIENINLISGMPELIEELKNEGAKLYLLSNISIGFAEKYKEVKHINDVLQYFDGLVFSGPIHTVKPHKEIFEHLLNEYSLKAEECIFIDDNQKNIEGARALGIYTYLFDSDVEKLKAFLNVKN